MRVTSDTELSMVLESSVMVALLEALSLAQQLLYSDGLMGRNLWSLLNRSR